MEYVAFLLGINIGTRTVKMADLKALMEREGYTGVHTVLASGNVRFQAKTAKPAVLAGKLEVAYEKQFGFKIGVIVRTMGDIDAMIQAEPFKKIRVTPDTRRYVMFLSERPASMVIPKSKFKEYKVLKVTPGEVYSVLEISCAVKTPDIMKALSVSYGKKVTVRNWNTIEKIAARG